MGELQLFFWSLGPSLEWSLGGTANGKKLPVARPWMDWELNHASALTERPVTQLVYRRHGGENNIKEFVALNYQWWKLLL